MDVTRVSSPPTVDPEIHSHSSNAKWTYIFLLGGGSVSLDETNMLFCLLFRRDLHLRLNETPT